jgi:hypothetical protein
MDRWNEQTENIGRDIQVDKQLVPLQTVR